MSEKFANDIEEMSYAMGMNMAEYLGNNPLEINTKVVLEGIEDYLAGNAKLSPEEYVQVMQALQKKMQDVAQEQTKKIAEENIKAGKDFLAENGKRAEVTTTASGLQYEVITAAEGKKPSATDQVRVHYTGTLLNGVTFDSSVARGEPAEFGVSQVIPGWTEALQLMSIGSKLKLFIPSDLAYGERGAGHSIPPNSTLIFDVELLDIV